MNNRPTTIEPGREVFIVKHSSYGASYTLATVSKVSPSGQITVAANGSSRRFTAHDSEIGGASSWQTSCLDWRVEEIKARRHETAKLERVESILNAVKRVEFKKTYGRDEAAKAIDEVRKALTAAEAELTKE